MRSRPPVVRLVRDAECERCGFTIRRGERAVAVVHEDAGVVHYLHPHCPTAAAVRPDFVGPLPLQRRLVPALA